MRRKGIDFRRAKSLTWEEADGTQTYVDGQPVPQHHVVIYPCQHIWDYEAERHIDPKTPKKGYEVMEESTRVARERYGDDLTWYRSTKPVKMWGHSRTNMVYGHNVKRECYGEKGMRGKHTFTKVYWVEDGRVYVGSFHAGCCSCND